MKHFYFKSIFLSLLMVVLGNVGALAQDTWVATDPGDLADGDVVAIVDLNDEVAMPNNNGASNAPVATKVTLSSDNTQITSSVAKNLQWTVMRSGDTYQFYASVEEDNETWLYCTNTNNGVRVGTNSNKNFNIVTDPNNNHANYLFNTATSRYFGVFIQNGVAQDWRCYTSINNNIKGTITKFFKKVASTRTLLGIQLSDYTTEFFVGDEFSFGGTVTALYEGGSTVAVTGSATFTGYDMSTPGNQTVTVSYSEGNVTKTDTYNITVKNRTLQSISAVAPKTEFEVGDTFTFGGTVTATYDDESTKDVTDEATFSGYNMSEAGTYPVTVSYTEGEVTKTAEYTITVSSVAPSSVTIEPDEVTVYLGNTSQLTATVGPNNATDKTVTWSSDNESVATVDQSGLVTPVSEGTAVITASANGAEGVKGECLITVAELTGDAYTLVTNVSDLKANDKVIIVNTEAGKAMGQQNNNNRAATEVNFDDDNNAIVPSNSDIQVFTLEGNSNGWYFNTGSGYIYAASNSSNHLKTQNGKDDNAKAVITITSDGTSVVFQRTSGRNTLQYNSTNDIFSCYASASQLPVQIYKMDGGEPALTYTLVAGEEETPFEGLTLAKELPAQVEFYIKDSNGNEYHSAEAQSELIIIAENHENLPTSPNGKNFYISKANTWVFTLTEPTNADESLTLTVVPQTPGETKYMLTPDYLVESELFFDDNFQVTKEFSASEAFFITRSDDYGLANLTAAESNVHEGGVETRVWEFKEGSYTAEFIPGKVLNAFCMKDAGFYTVTLNFTNNTVTVEPIANQYTLVVKDGDEYNFSNNLTLTQALPAQVEFYIKDSNGKVYYTSEGSTTIITSENHENLPTSVSDGVSESGKNFYISKANTWVFTLTEPANADESLTLTVVPQTPGETKYMLTPDYLQESEIFFDENFKVSKEFTAGEAFFITRSDDYGLANLTAAESNVHEGGVETRVWEFSEDAPTVGFIPGKVLNTFCMKEAGIYTVALDFTNNTVTVTDEVTAIGNLNNSDTGVFAGEEGFSSGTHNITGTLTTAVGDVTVNYNGTTNSYLNDNHIRTYLNGTTLKFTAPSGYDLTKIVLIISSGNSKNLTADCGEYELTADKIATWTGSERAVTFTGQTSTNRITTAEVTLEEAAPRAQLESIAVEGQKTEFLVGSTFEFGGTVTATYDDESTKDVTEDATFSEPDMTTPGEQTVTVSYTEDEVTKTVDYTITVKEPETIKFRKITSTDELEAGKRYVLVNEEAQKVIAEYYNLHFNVNDATISDERVTLLETEANILTLGGEEGAWTFATSIEAGKYLYFNTPTSGSSGSNYLNLGDDATVLGSQWTISFDDKGNAVIQTNYNKESVDDNHPDRYIRYNSSQPRFACYTGTQKPVQLYVESDLEDVTLTIKAVGYATLYYSDRALKVPDGVTAKTYKVVGGKLAESKKYVAGSNIPAGEAVVLKGAAGEYTFLVTSTTEPKDADNMLKGSDEAEMTTGGNYYYALQAKAKDGSGGPGMYWMNSTGAAFENGAHKAYLALDEKFAEAQSVGGAKSFYLFDEATTGISSIGAETDDRTEMYNLNGQSVDRGYKGVVIKNGKKFLKK